MAVTEEGFVEWQGHRTWYRIVGNRSSTIPLLTLHGGPGSTHHYFGPLERLGEERAVVVYDQLGCGSSDHPEGIDWSLELFRDEVVAVRERLGLDEIHLLGTSWGGMLAQEHVLSGAGGVRSLVLSSTLASLDQWVEEQKRLVRELPAEVVNVGHPEYEQTEALYMDRHFYRGPKPRAELERWAAERATDVYEAMQGPNEWTPTGKLRGWDIREQLHEIDVPTLVVRGRYDMCTESIAATLVEGIPNAREVVFEHSSHTPVLEESDRYLEVVGAFLRQND
jgi:proline-specific peptidase